MALATPYCAQYTPPLSELPKSVSFPPQTIISLPVHTAVGIQRLEGALIVLVALQLFVAGLYLPPVPLGNEVFPAPDDHFITSPNC